MTKRIWVNPDRVEATYYQLGVPEYDGNPFPEALGAPLEDVHAARLMRNLPHYDESYRTRSVAERTEILLPLLDEVRQPMPVHLDVRRRYARLIRGSYIGRNPLRGLERNGTHAAIESAFGPNADVAARVSWGRTEPRGFGILGDAGIGKSAMNRMVLKATPQVIRHTEYKGLRFGVDQLTHLTLDAPKDGSIKELCHAFFREADKLLETDYFQLYVRRSVTIQHLMGSMAAVAAEHGLGLLVIDEIQRLINVGARPLLDFLSKLMNTVGVPVVVIGGLDALQLVQEDLGIARRLETDGDLLIARAQLGEDWHRFVETLWRYQFTVTPTPLTDELLRVLYYESQGITDFVVRIYKRAQALVIGDGQGELITSQVLVDAAKTGLASARPHLTALQKGDTDKLMEFDDAKIPGGTHVIPFARADKGNAATVTMATPAENAVPKAGETRANDVPSAPGAVEPVKARRPARAKRRTWSGDRKKNARAEAAKPNGAPDVSSIITTGTHVSTRVTKGAPSEDAGIEATETPASGVSSAPAALTEPVEAKRPARTKGRTWSNGRNNNGRIKPAQSSSAKNGSQVTPTGTHEIPFARADKGGGTRSTRVAPGENAVDQAAETQNDAPSALGAGAELVNVKRPARAKRRTWSSGRNEKRRDKPAHSTGAGDKSMAPSAATPLPSGRTLPEIVAQGKLNGESAYAALLSAGIIRSSHWRSLVEPQVASWRAQERPLG